MPFRDTQKISIIIELYIVHSQSINTVIMVRVSIVVLALVVLAGHHAYGQEESSRLGFGKQMSKDLIESTLLLKAQVLNNTNRIHVLQSRIPANTARTETLQELADENTNTINDQFGLLGDLNNTIFSVMDRVRDEVTFPSVGILSKQLSTR
eukprot:jgi/Picre1/30622/NNA_005983.t1